MDSRLRRTYSRTFLDDMTLGDGEIDDWVDSALSGDFVKEFLELGEESLEFSAAEDELRKLQTKLNDAESRESRLKQALDVKDDRISHLEDVIDQLKKELVEERSRARDEAEDMAQEMAELRYELTEMLEEERALRARTEQVSVHRVEELEAQVKQARQEAVDALARRQESECQAEKELAELRSMLKEARQQLRDTNDALTLQAANQACDKCTGYVEETERLMKEVLELKHSLQTRNDEILELQNKLLQRAEERQRADESADPCMQDPHGEAENEVPSKGECCPMEALANQGEDAEPSTKDEALEIQEPSSSNEEVLENHAEDVKPSSSDGENRAEDEETPLNGECATMEAGEVTLENQAEAEELPLNSERLALEKDRLHVNALEQKIREILASEIELQVERSCLLSEVAELKTQVDHFRHELQASSEQHSEAVARHEEEKSMMEEETKLSRDSLSAEISQLQQTVEGQGLQQELAQKELAVYQTNLEKETDLTQELSSRLKVLETELNSERKLHVEAASKCLDFSQSLDVAMQKLFTLESEMDVMKNESEALQKSLQTAESQVLETTKEKHALQENIQQLNVHVHNQEHRINRLQQELVSQRAANNQLAKKVGELNSEVVILQQQLITCQTQASEMAMKNVILEDTVVAKKRKIKDGEQTIIQQAEKLGRQEEKYFNLQAKFSALQNDFSVLESKLSETRRREQDIRIQVERLSLELNMAKQEVVNSEVRLQKSMKQAKEQLDAHNLRHEEVLNKHRQTEWFLNRKIEHLKRSEAEKEQLQNEVGRLSSGSY